MILTVKRKGQIPSPMMPSYRLIQEFERDFLVEYCGVWKFLPKTQYEKFDPQY